MTARTVRLAFWNTWLLAPRLGRSGPRLPGLEGWFAPDVEARAPLVGRAVADHFDVAALSEVFERSELEAVGAAWPDATVVPGPRRQGLRIASSGLATLVGPSLRVARTAQHVYRSGGDLRDSDTFAAKGALLTSLVVAPDLPQLEVLSTHLLAGGDLFPLPGAEDRARHHRARMAQVDELIGFIERVHDPDSPLLVVGDFNVVAHHPTGEDPTADHCDLAERMGRAGLRDLWASDGIGPGHTCTFASPSDLPPDPDEPDRVLDDADASAADAPGERIDYLWLSTPPQLSVDVERPRRWAFPGRGATGGPAGSLSDHLALSVTLHLG